MKYTSDDVFDPGATASSGLVVSYTSSNIRGKHYIRENPYHSAGATTISASQAGDMNFNPASGSVTNIYGV